MVTVPTKKLNVGSRIPVLGFATRTLTSDNSLATLRTAIDSGCRHIDCASFHHNENDIGIALEKLLQEGYVKRSELFITGKHSPANVPSETVRESLQRTLTQLRIDYLDLYLLQDPNNMTVQQTLLQKSESLKGNKRFNLSGVWKDVEVLQREGLARSIGLANFKAYHVETILKNCSISPAVHQVNSKTLSNEHIEYCQQKGIAVATYTQLRQRGSTTRSIDNDRRMVKEIASKHGKTTAQINIKSQIQHGLISVVESAKPTLIQSKFQVFDFELDSCEVRAVLALDKKQRSPSNSDGQEFRLIDIIDEKPTKHHRRWERGRVFSNTSDE